MNLFLRIGKTFFGAPAQSMDKVGPRGSRMTDTSSDAPMPLMSQREIILQVPNQLTEVVTAMFYRLLQNHRIDCGIGIIYQ